MTLFIDQIEVANGFISNMCFGVDTTDVTMAFRVNGREYLLKEEGGSAADAMRALLQRVPLKHQVTEVKLNFPHKFLSDIFGVPESDIVELILKLLK